MRRAILVLVAATLLVGCGRTQLRDAADLKAGAVAFQNAEAAGATPEQLAQIGRGLAAYARAVLDGMALPAPSMEPAAIALHPEDYADDAADAQADPAPVELFKGGKDPAATPGVFERIAHWGGLLLDSGLLLAGIGLILWAISWAGDTWSWAPTGWLLKSIWWIAKTFLFPLSRVATVWGGFSTAVGAALIWLVAYWWAVALVILAASGFVIWDHWKSITKWWRKRHVLPRQTPAPTGGDHA